MKLQPAATKRFTAGDIAVMENVIELSVFALVKSDDESMRDHQRQIMLARRVLAKIKQRVSEKK